MLTQIGKKKLHDFLWFMGCAFQQQEMQIIILMIDIIVTNMLIKANLYPKSAISDYKWAKIEKNALKDQQFDFFV